MKRWSEKDTERLRYLAETTDLSAAEIGKRLGRNRNSIISRCRRKNIALPLPQGATISPASKRSDAVQTRAVEPPVQKKATKSSQGKPGGKVAVKARVKHPSVNAAHNRRVLPTNTIESYVVSAAVAGLLKKLVIAGTELKQARFGPGERTKIIAFQKVAEALVDRLPPIPNPTRPTKEKTR